MEQFLIELFTLLFFVSDNSLLVFLTPILAPIASLAVMVGGVAIIVIPFMKVYERYLDSDAYKRREERAKIKSLQRALDLWEHGYIEYYAGESHQSAGGKLHYIERKENYVGTDVYNESQHKALEALLLGLVPNKKLPRGVFWGNASH